MPPAMDGTPVPAGRGFVALGCGALKGLACAAISPLKSPRSLGTLNSSVRPPSSDSTGCVTCSGTSCEQQQRSGCERIAGGHVSYVSPDGLPTRTE